MVQLVDGDIKTLRGARLEGRARPALHGLVARPQKLRIFLNLKGIKWESHLVDLFANENFQRRGLVPVLVHDGARAHREQRHYPASGTEISEPRRSFRPATRTSSWPCSSTRTTYSFARSVSDFVSTHLVSQTRGNAGVYAANGAGTVGGIRYRDKAIQIEFWQRAAKEGFSDERARASANKFRVALDAISQLHSIPI